MAPLCRAMLFLVFFIHTCIIFLVLFLIVDMDAWRELSKLQHIHTQRVREKARADLI